MRPTDSNATQYQPGEPPNDPAQLPLFLRQEFAKMKAALDTVASGYAPVTYVLPPKPRAGMVRNFDGTQANPGGGAGIYRYTGSAWVMLVEAGAHTASADALVTGYVSVRDASGVVRKLAVIA